MQVKIFAALRGITGAPSVEIEASTVADLVGALERRYGEAFRDELLRDGRLRPGAVLLVNGVNVHALRGLETPLTPDDTVAIFPLLGGG